MPRKHPLPERERRICTRLAEFRAAIKLTRAAFAREIGVNRFTLANVEGSAAPVTFALALRIQDRLQMNLAWLATGEGEIYGKPKFHRSFIPSESELLSSAFDKYLKPAVENRERLQGMAKDAGLTLDFPDAIGVPVAEVYASRMLPDLATALRSINPQSWGEYQRALNQASQDFIAGEKQSLTSKSNIRNYSSVKLTLKGLMDKVRKLTEPAGMKSKLATDLKVPPSRVSEWLSGKHDPSGEVTLQLLQWVQQQEQAK